MPVINNRVINNNIKEFLPHTQDLTHVKKKKKKNNLRSAKYKNSSENKKESSAYYFPKISEKDYTPPSNLHDVEEFLRGSRRFY